MILISKRQQVAQIRGAPVYVITDVTFIPLSTEDEARKAIVQANGSLKSTPGGADGVASDNDVSEDDERSTTGQVDEYHDQDSPTCVEPLSADDPALQQRPAGPNLSTTNVAKDVIGSKGQYGRFAERWFSKKGWTSERRRTLGMSVDDSPQPPSTTAQVSKEGTQQSDSASTPNAAEAGTQKYDIAKPVEATASSSGAKQLLPKLLKTTRVLLISNSFFYSYDMDITRRLGTGSTTGSDLPLHKAVDPLVSQTSTVYIRSRVLNAARKFFWNSHLVKPFVDGQYHAFILPIMQGFVGQRAFSLERNVKDSAQAISSAAEDPKEVIQAQASATMTERDSSLLITLISRRTIKRPGLRYLRRGVDDEGHTANSVETEQLLSKASWVPSEKIYSFTQIRGSIPLFFSQSPYAFKPVPVLQHSAATNEAAFKQHFRMLINRYGQIQIVLLVDKSGGEAEIGNRYEAFTQKYNDEQKDEQKKLQFEWFDFHNICRGMKFENVGVLLDSLGNTLDRFGRTIEVNGKMRTKQEGVLRTNCMDCLDRTNVVQSACGRRALEEQLKSEGFSVNLKNDVSTQWFNTLWADNGDAISKQYSSTAALKGDYTRTRHRNYRGAINDIGLSITRYYNNIVNDFFSQASIDFLLGNVTPQVFEDFEDRMMSGDPGMSMQKIRDNAINTSTKIVIEDGTEDLVGGWTILSPHEPNTVKSLPLEEVVLLLTDSALYKVCYDWNNEKVASFEKIDLRNITGIMKGTYVTSTLASAQTDEQRNVGFIMKYSPGKEDVARVNTRTMSSVLDGLEENEEENKKAAASLLTKHDVSSNLRILAFKALPARSALATADQEGQHMSETELISSICEDIKRCARRDRGAAANLVEDQDIISLQEAKKNTGLAEQWGHSLKRFVWG